MNISIDSCIFEPADWLCTL